MLAGRRLHDLRSERNAADYDLDIAVALSSAAGHTRLAGQLIQILDTGRVEPVRTQIRDAMRVYEQTVLRVVTWQGP